MKAAGKMVYRLLMAAAFSCWSTYAADGIMQSNETIIVTIDDYPVVDTSHYLVTTNSVTRTNDHFYCSVHHERLHKDVVPVVYGFVSTSVALRDAKQTLFPHAATSVLGGCCVIPPMVERLRIFTPGSTMNYPAVKDVRFTDKRIVLYCPICREAQQKWLVGHGIRPN